MDATASNCGQVNLLLGFFPVDLELRVFFGVSCELVLDSRTLELRSPVESELNIISENLLLLIDDGLWMDALIHTFAFHAT